ncbi:MAG TPA: drug:proton antiporter, partial [Thermoanaerobaculia bacterium]
MFDPSLVILYVDQPEASSAFYAELIGRQPVETSPTFCLFVLGSGVKLGLWSKHTVEPAATATGGGGELCFLVDGVEAVDRT